MLDGVSYPVTSDNSETRLSSVLSQMASRTSETLGYTVGAPTPSALCAECSVFLHRPAWCHS